MSCAHDDPLWWRHFEGWTNLTVTVAEQILHLANAEMTVEKV